MNPNPMHYDEYMRQRVVWDIVVYNVRWFTVGFLIEVGMGKKWQVPTNSIKM